MSASKAFAFSLALLLGAGTETIAQNTINYDEVISGGSDSSGSVSGATPIGSAGGYFWVQGDFGERPGVAGNYASFGSFAPIDFLGPEQSFFIDAQVMVNDDSELGASGGLGFRQLVEPWGSILGVNSFYTFDQSRNSFSYNQGSVGAEWLTDYFQVTANAYIPFDMQPNAIGPEIKTKNSIFLNDNMAFINIQNAETQQRGADIDIAVPIPGAQWLTLAGGGYVYDGKFADSYKGFRGRLQADFTNVLLNLSLAKDDVYGNQMNFAATYFFGSQNGNYSPRSKSLYDRMNDRVRRSARIVTRDIVINPLELAINPRTGLPWTFAHFDNTAAAGGDGSNEARYNALVASTPADALLIHRGSTTRANLMAGGTGVTLNDFQLVFGEGNPTFIAVANRPGPPCPLPSSWATTGTNPFVTANNGSNVFTLADNNLITGINIIAPTGGNAIVGNNIENFTLERLNRDINPATTDTGPGGGILITNASGTGIIRDFGFDIPSANGPSGIIVSNTNTDPLSLSITDGRFINGGRFGINVTANNSIVGLAIDNVDNNASATGLQLQTTNSGRIIAGVTDSHFDGAVGGLPGTGNGISVLSNNGQTSLTIENTTATGAARSGLQVELSAGASAEIGMTDVDLSNSLDSIQALLSASRLNLTGTRVTGTDATDDGFDFRLLGGSEMTAILVDGNLSGANGDSVTGSLSGASTANVFINNTSLAGAGGNGVVVANGGASSFTGVFTGSSLDGAGADGVNLQTSGASNSLLVLNNSDATNAGANGLVVNTTGNSRADVGLQNQSFDNAAVDAIQLSADTNSITLVSGQGVSGASAGDDGIQISSTTGSLVGLNLTDTGSFAGVGDDGINFNASGNSRVSIDIAGAPSSFNGAGGDGIQGNLSNSVGQLTLTDVTFQSAGGEGIGVTATNSIFSGSVTNGSFNDAGSNGARLTLNNSVGNLLLSNTDLFSAGGDALQVDATVGSSSLVQLLGGISLDNAGDDAIDLNSVDSLVQVQGNQVSGANATDDAIHLNAERGRIDLLLGNALSFTSPGGDGIDFTAADNSTLNITIQGFPVAAFDDAGRNGVTGTLTGNSTTNLNLVNSSFERATLEGFGVTATDSTFNGSITNSSFDDAGSNGVRLSLNNSVGNLHLSNVDARRAGGTGLAITGTAASTSDSTLSDVRLDGATADALLVNSALGSDILLRGTGISGASAGDDGIDLTATTGSSAQIILDGVSNFERAADDGIVFLGSGLNSFARVELTGPLGSFDEAGSNGVNGTILGGAVGLLNLNDISFRQAGNDGIRTLVNGNNSILFSNLTTVALDTAGGDALQLISSAGGQTLMTGNGVTGSAATGDGINLSATTSSLIDLNLSGVGSFEGAGGDGIDFTGTGNSTINLTLNGNPASFDNATGHGITGTLDASTATVNLTNTTFRNAGLDGLHLDLQNNSLLNGTIIGSDFSRPGPAPSGDDGLDISLNNSDLNLTVTSAVNNAGDDAIHLEALAGSLLNLKVNGGPLLNAGGDMTDITALGGSVVNYGLDPAATGANQNGLRFDVQSNSILNAIITNSPMSTALDPVGENGVLGFVDTNGEVNLTLVNSDITSATLDALNVTAQGGSRFNAVIRNSQMSNAGQDGFDLTLNNATSNILIDNSDIAGVGGDALRVNGTDATLNLRLANGISLDNAGGNAVELTGLRSTLNVTGTGSGPVTGANAGDDAIHLDGIDSNINLLLGDAGSFAGAGGDGIDITGNNSTIGLRFRGAAAGAASLNGAVGNGIVAHLTNNSLAQFDVDNFSIDGSGLNGILLDLDASRITGSSFTNGQVDDNGVAGVVGSRNGLQVIADNGSSIGTRTPQTPGLIFNNVSFRNDPVLPLQVPRTQQNGVNIAIDGDTFAGINILNSQITRNDGNGVLIDVNGDASLNDTSLAALGFDNAHVDNNWGDGFQVTARNGVDDPIPPQQSGAIITFLNGTINANGNFINNPATGVIGDGIGDGIDARALGDGSGPGNTQITFNLNNSDILGNEESPLAQTMTDGGSVNYNLTGGNVDGNFEIPCADGPLAFVSFTLNGTNISSTSALVLCAKNNGVLNATVANVDFSDNPGQGILILAETGGDITANLSNMNVQRNGTNPGAPISMHVNPPITTIDGAIQGVVDGAGSSLNLVMDSMNVTDNDVAGLDLIASNGGDLIARISNSDFSDNGLGGPFDGILFDVSGAGTNADVRLTNVLADNATDDGVDFRATAGSNLDLEINGLSAQSAAADGLSLLVDGATARLEATTIDVDNADGRAVNIVANNAGANLTIAALDNITGQNAGQEGMNIDITNGANVDFVRSQNLNFNDSGRLNPAANGVDVLVSSGGTSSLLVMNNLSADNAGGTGLLVTATDPASRLDGVSITGGSFLNAGNNGVDIAIANQTTPTDVFLRNIAANDANNRGVRVNLNAVTGGESDVLIDNVSANNAGGDDGLEVTIAGLGATDTAQLGIVNGSSFNNAANEGVDVNLDGAAGSRVRMTVNGLSANDATNDGININATTGVNLYSSTFDNVSATGAGGDGLQVSANGAAGVVQFHAGNVNVSGAGGDGVNMNLDTQSLLSSIEFNGLDASNAGGTGVDIVLDGVPGRSSVMLLNVDASDAQGGEGVNLDVLNLGATDRATLTLNNVDVSNANEDGLNIQLDGAVGSQANVYLDGLTATGDRRDGIDLSLTDGITATVGQFDNVISTQNGENGIQVDVSSGSTLSSFTADSLDLSQNGTSGIGFDGLDVQIRDAGSNARFTMSNLTINNSGGRGIDLDTFNNGSLVFNMTGATIDQSGLGGIDLNVGSLDEFGSPVVPGVPGTFTGRWTDVTVTNSGQSALFFADGINVDVDGAGTTADLVFDHVLSNNNDEDGFDIRVDNGANGAFAVNNASAGNNNRGTGFELAADGAATVLSLTSASGVLGDNTFNNNTGDPATNLDGPGVAITLTNAVTATDLVIGASATGNDGDGLRILANDGTGVTINNFGISGNALQVNNNLGNGLLIDFFNVNGVNAFDLANMTVSGNQLDQIHAAFRQMTMDHISLDNVTTTGIAGSDDGIEISLLDTQLTRPAANGYAFSATNVLSSNNGGYGLNLVVDESGVPNGIQTAGITNGLIRQSEFANNGAAGLRMSFGGDSQADFDIINNTAGFHNNAEEGILVEVQDDATYRMTGTNLILAGAQSMYDNQIVDNGGIGFRIVASEPLDTNLIVPDAVGPRIELDLGDILRNPNTITGNVDAAMAVEMSGDAAGQFTMVNSILTQTTNGANANFNGDGLAFRLTDFAALESLTINGATAGLDISDNAGSGLVTNVSRFAELGTNSRLTVLNTTIQRNGLHGIDIQRADDGLYGPDTANNGIIIGSVNNGNLLRDNVQNGLNIVLGNTPGGILPFQIDVTDNTLERNLNGIFLNGTGNAQFIGNISDNDFDGQRQDGIQVVLENNAAIGDPRLANNPLLTPFMFEGNQVLNSARDGIRFDTNFTNEAGNFGGGAYANVLITDSVNFVDGFGDPVRTLISGNGVHGVNIIDNSDFVAGPGAAVTRQNTYRIIESDITANAVDGIHANVGANTGIRDANNGIALIIGDPANADQRDVTITFNGDDGIDLELAGADSITNNVRISHSTINNNGANGDATGGNGIETDVMNFGVVVNGTGHFGSGSLDMLLETLDVQENADDGLRFDVTSTRQNQAKTLEGTALSTNAVTLVEMFGVDTSLNGGRGLYANLQHDRLPLNQFNGLGPAGQSSTSVFNIGRGDRFNDPTAVNRFNGNGREGIVFDQQATGMDQDTTNRPTGWPHVPGLVDVNDDVWVETDLPQFYTQFPAWSSGHLMGGINFNPSLQETRVHLTTTVNFIQNEVANNGTNFEDGVAFGIGALTRLNTQIAGNSFGGNVGDDIRFYPQRSNDINPPNSFQDTANDGPHSHLVYDPVAYADIILGAVDTNLDGNLDIIRGNGLSPDANGAASNGVGAGEQITVLTFGTNQTAQITNDGVFTNADAIKGTNRPVPLVGQVRVNGVWDDETINDFVENGVQQIIDNQFNFFDQLNTTNFPDGIFP